MKKSEQYRLAQLSVLRDPNLGHEVKLKVLNTLMIDENLAKIGDERKEAAQNESV